MKKLIYYLPGLLFAAIAPIYVFISYPEIQTFAGPNSILRFAFVFALLFVVLAFVCFLPVREHLPAGLISSCIVLGILYPLYPFIFIISAIIVASVLLAALRKGSDLLHPHVASVAVSIVIAFYVGMEYVLVRQSVAVYEDVPMVETIEIDLSAPENKEPDIYYIILDAYAGESVLRELHDFDNSAFTYALQERGFTIPLKSRSNYLRTMHSLNSSLNMQYLDSLSDTMGDSPLWWPLQENFTDSEIRRLLEEEGYQTVVVASGWDFTTMTNADVYKQPYPIFLNKFEEFFIGNTNLALFRFLKHLGVSFPGYDTHRHIVLQAFQVLKEIPELDSPKFTFVHIISPHPPFVFDSEGAPIDPDYPFTLADNRDLISPPSKYQEGYLEQLAFVNDQVLGVVDAILEKSVDPPLIVIQGDHGPGIFIDAPSSSPPCFAERYSILNAYYLPGIDPALVPQDITPVNTFRLIFNHYFATDLEFLPNHQYFSPQEAIHQFGEVTNLVDNACIFPDEGR